MFSGLDADTSDDAQITGAHVVEDPGGQYTDVVFEQRSETLQSGGTANAQMIVRLDGVTGYTAEQLLP